MNLTPTELRLQASVERREIARAKADELIGEDNLSDTHEQHLTLLREEMDNLDGEIDQLLKDKESDDKAKERSKLVHRAMLAEVGGGDGDGPVYRDFATYARDVILTRDSRECSKIASQFGDNAAIESARNRLELLKRVPANTLSSDVAGLNPPEHIAQIFQIIDKSRPLVAAAPSTGLVRGTITYPSVDTRPVVAVQASEKTEAGNTGMAVSMKTATAVTYLGGGDLSWQAINWSTPDALSLWFDLVAADYALKTETAAADVAGADAQSNGITDRFTMGSSDFTAFLKAVGEGYAKVYSASHRIANTILMAPDVYGYLIGLTSTPQPIFISVNGQNIGPLNVIVSRGIDSGTAMVCDLAGFLTAETPGAPVELRVVEPAIGGLEVGLIGAFKPVVVDPGSFSLISAGS